MYIYIYTSIYIHTQPIHVRMYIPCVYYLYEHTMCGTGVCEQKTLPQRRRHMGRLASETPSQGLERAVSAAGLHGQGSRKRNDFFTDTGTIT